MSLTFNRACWFHIGAVMQQTEIYMVCCVCRVAKDKVIIWRVYLNLYVSLESDNRLTNNLEHLCIYNY